MIRAAVMGATGYGGGDVIRLLVSHPHVQVTMVTTSSQAGQPLGQHQPQLAALDLTLEPANLPELADRADVVFMSLPHGAAMALAPGLLARGVRVIDLGADFRLKDPEEYTAWYHLPHACPELLTRAVYGLPELYRDVLAGCALVANPGCYPTAVLLALAPWKELASTSPVLVDAKSGVSGAGRKADLALAFCEVNENIKPYNLAGVHRHTPEIEQVASSWCGAPVRVSFNPHLVPMNRGILATVYLPLEPGMSAQKAHHRCAQFYAGEPFVQVLPPGDLPQTRHTLGTNRCLLGVAVDHRAGFLVLVSAIDNLGKGAAGQAVQNLNLMFGLPETTGLMGPALVP
ncbi:MAG: N-acetyl-gamma-glutamyl-phosphate reductase [Bacillota bacterium]